MTFFESITTCFKKYADFTGCASRSELWWFFLFCALASAACAILSDALQAIFAIATLVPIIAVATRRLHDTDRSGWMQLLGFIPVIGGILLLIWYCTDSKRPTRFLAETTRIEQA